MTGTVLVTGGAGYIGSHTCVELLTAGFEVVVLDNFCNSHPESLRRVGQIAARRVDVIEGDVCDKNLLRTLFANRRFDAVIHFAGLKAVGESVEQPQRYYENNVYGSIALAQAMQDAGVFRLVFSSSATVYGEPEKVPVPEGARFAPASPYGWSKAMVEQILTDIGRSDPRWHVALLRYFNPVGAHPSGQIGEDPFGPPNNLFPYVAQVAVGKRPLLTVHGNDYATRDGTGERDYIHVVDLARGHVAALTHLDQFNGAKAINLGRGIGNTVMEVLHAFEAACGKTLPYVVGPRRDGDVACYYADPNLAHQLLGWRAQLDIAQACADTWRWQSNYPDGFAGSDSAR